MRATNGDRTYARRVGCTRRVALAAMLALACRGSGPPVADDGNVADGDGAAAKGPGLAGIARSDVVSDGWTVEPDDRGSVRIRHRHADVIRASYLFFGP